MLNFKRKRHAHFSHQESAAGTTTTAGKRKWSASMSETGAAGWMSMMTVTTHMTMNFSPESPSVRRPQWPSRLVHFFDKAPAHTPKVFASTI
jgi:hypothetical protein